MPIVIGRAINGIAANGLQYLMDKNTESGYMTFENEDAARQFMRDNIFPDSTDEELNDYCTFRNVDDVVKEDAFYNRIDDEVKVYSKANGFSLTDEQVNAAGNDIAKKLKQENIYDITEKNERRVSEIVNEVAEGLR